MLVPNTNTQEHGVLAMMKRPQDQGLDPSALHSEQ
jgi:hypothetical protein